MDRKQLSEKMKDLLVRCYLRPDRPDKALAVAAAKGCMRRDGLKAPWSDSTLRRWLKEYVCSYPSVVASARKGW